MKRVLSLVAASLVALVLAGCGEEAPKPAPVVPETTQPADAAPAAEPAAAPADAQPAEGSSN